MKSSVGEKIRSIREGKGIEINQLAERTQLPVEKLRNIEEGSPLPGLAPLLKIARVLGVRLGTFLDDSLSFDAVVCRNGEVENRESARFSNHNVSECDSMIYRSLSEGKENRSIEPFVIDILPVAQQEYETSSHEGEEFIYVLEGKVEIIYGKQVYMLEKGDSIYYDAIVNHHVHSGNGQKAKILAVVYTPV